MKRTRVDAPKSRSNPPAMAQRPRLRGKPRTDLLVSGDKQPRAASPVSAQRVFRHTAAGSPSPDDRQRRESRAAKRQLEERLWRKYMETRGDEDRNALWLHYQGLVRHIAERQMANLPGSVELEDLISLASIGLLNAIGKFDPDRGVEFMDYCVPRIRAAMVDSVRATDWVPLSARKRSSQLEGLVAALAIDLDREPTNAELAAHLGIDLKRLAVLRSDLKAKPKISFEGARFTKDMLIVRLSDGREVGAPLEWFPRLRRATAAQRSNWRLIGRGVGLHWEDVDEDISVRSLLTL